MQKRHTYELPHPVDLSLGYREWRATQVDSLEWLEENDWLVPDSSLLDDDSDDFHNEYKFSHRSIKVLAAPTGSGKTGVILALAAMNTDLRFLIMCATKLEQDQYTENMMSDFEFKFRCMSIRGRNNYHCAYVNPGHGDTVPCEESNCFLTHVADAPCTAGMECEIKKEGGCGYYSLVGLARRKQIIITTYAYGLTMLNYASDAFGKFDVIICDEAHILDGQLEQFIQVQIYRQRFLNLFGMPLPEFDKGGTISEWSAWIRHNLNDMQEAVDQLESDSPEDMTKQEIKNFNSATDYLDGLCQIAQLEKEWVVESSKQKIEVKPVWVTGDSKDVIFDHADRFVLLSGTIPSAKLLAKKVGIKPNSFSFKRLPYEFPVENRLIYVHKGVPLSHDVLKDNLAWLTDELDEILMRYAYEVKILVHTVTYNIAKYLGENSAFNTYMHLHDQEDRMLVLQEFKRASAPAILVSPSMDKAVDLPGDECGRQIICKIPYPNLGSPVMKRRSRQDRQYYLNETLMSVMQMTGRGVRNTTDVCPTDIIDAAGRDFFKSVKRLIPEGFKEAIRMEDS